MSYATIICFFIGFTLGIALTAYQQPAAEALLPMLLLNVTLGAIAGAFTGYMIDDRCDSRKTLTQNTELLEPNVDV